jgi:hypothetical protein
MGTIFLRVTVKCLESREKRFLNYSTGRKSFPLLRCRLSDQEIDKLAPFPGGKPWLDEVGSTKRARRPNCFS